LCSNQLHKEHANFKRDGTVLFLEPEMREGAHQKNTVLSQGAKCQKKLPAKHRQKEKKNAKQEKKSPQADELPIRITGKAASRGGLSQFLHGGGGKDTHPSWGLPWGVKKNKGLQFGGEAEVGGRAHFAYTFTTP